VASLMFKARNSGKKQLAVRIVKDTFDIIHLLTDENPLSVRTASPHWLRVGVLALAAPRCRDAY
jgi:hypothetical protein